MRQRVRRIVVDGAVYRWRVRPADPHWLSVRVWRDGERVHMADLRVRFDDPWLHLPEMSAVAARTPERFDEFFATDPLRPGRVAELIRAWVGRQEG